VGTGGGGAGTGTSGRLLASEERGDAARVHVVGAGGASVQHGGDGGRAARGARGVGAGGGVLHASFAGDDLRLEGAVGVGEANGFALSEVHNVAGAAALGGIEHGVGHEIRTEGGDVGVVIVGAGPEDARTGVEHTGVGVVGGSACVIGVVLDGNRLGIRGVVCDDGVGRGCTHSYLCEYSADETVSAVCGTC